MGVIYEVHRSDVLRRHDMHLASFMTIGFGVQVILRVVSQQTYLNYDIELTSGGIKHLSSIMTVGIDIRVILRVLPKNLRGCNVGTTDDRNL
jgi:hypothetical protein